MTGSHWFLGENDWGCLAPKWQGVPEGGVTHPNDIILCCRNKKIQLSDLATVPTIVIITKWESCVKWNVPSSCMQSHIWGKLLLCNTHSIEIRDTQFSHILHETHTYCIYLTLMCMEAEISLAHTKWFTKPDHTATQLNHRLIMHTPI